MTVRRVGLWVAVVALLVAQTLGLAHRVVHPGGAVAGVEYTHAHTHGHEHESGHHPSPLAALFAGHDEAPDCRLYDQLSHADLLPALPVAVNLSARQITPELPAQLFACARERGVAPGMLELEVTETAMIRDHERAKRILLALKRHGVDC